VAGGQIFPSPIDFHRRPYNTLALPCERVMDKLQFLVLITVITIVACINSARQSALFRTKYTNRLSPENNEGARNAPLACGQRGGVQSDHHHAGDAARSAAPRALRCALCSSSNPHQQPRDHSSADVTHRQTTACSGQTHPAVADNPFISRH